MTWVVGTMEKLDGKLELSQRARIGRLYLGIGSFELLQLQQSTPTGHLQASKVFLNLHFLISIMSCISADEAFA